MEAFITSLTSQLTIASLWAAIAPAAPLIVVGVLFAIGYMVLRKGVKGIGKGKGTI